MRNSWKGWRRRTGSWGRREPKKLEMWSYFQNLCRVSTTKSKKHVWTMQSSGKHPMLTRLRTTPGCWKVFGSGALFHLFTKWRRMLDSCQRVLHASGPDPPEPQEAPSRKRDARGPQGLSSQPSCGGAHNFFGECLQKKHNDKSKSTWQDHEEATRRLTALRLRDAERKRAQRTRLRAHDAQGRRGRARTRGAEFAEETAATSISLKASSMC